MNIGLRPVTLGDIFPPGRDPQTRGWDFLNPPIGLTLQAGQSVPLVVRFATTVPGDFGGSGSVIPVGGGAPVEVPVTAAVRATPAAFEMDDTALTAIDVPMSGARQARSLHALRGLIGGLGFGDPARETVEDTDWVKFTLTQTMAAIEAAAAQRPKIPPHRRPGAHPVRPNDRRA